MALNPLMSLKETLIEYLEDNGASHLKTLYDANPNEKESTIRGRINENLNKCFKRISRGVYIAITGDSQTLLIEGNAWDAIDDFEDESFDAIITDPPYSALDHQMQTGSTRPRNLKKGWDFETNDIDEELFSKMLRVLKPRGHFFCFMPSCKHDTIDYIYSQVKLAEKAGFTFNSQWVWDKKVISLGYNGRPRHELILFFSKDKRKMTNDRSIPDVLAFKRLMGKNQKIHQTEKPGDLIMKLVEFATDPGDIILDPFAGSFSLGLACQELGRHAIGIELNKEFAKAAADRMRSRMDLC